MKRISLRSPFTHSTGAAISATACYWPCWKRVSGGAPPVPHWKFDRTTVQTRHLYQKFGFYQAAVRKSYYTDNGENALVMWADNIDSVAYREALLTIGNSFETPTF